MYFSAVDGGWGVIYHLNRHSGESNKFVEFQVETIAQKTRGFWNGNFAFSRDDKLFLSIDDAQPGGLIDL
jgi:parvulin-like peptidyl-prolyl isomerase